MSEVLSEVLKIYAETSEPVTQHFYQGLCLQAIEQIADLQAQLAKLQWVKVSERLPEKEEDGAMTSEWVRVSDGRYCFQAWYDFSVNEWRNQRDLTHETITHWKPIDLPDKEKSDE